jgi:predicted Zn-dependent protease
VLVQLTGCSSNPATGEREVTLVSEESEREVGRETDRQIVEQHGLVDDPALQAYVEGLGRRLVAVGPRPHGAYQFRILDDVTVNAFAVPGGYVYVTRGLLPYLRDEAALVGVLAHELGHVTARHYARRQTREIITGLPTALPRLLGMDLLTGALELLGAPVGLLLLKNSRDDELEADELGVGAMTELGYDSRSLAAFFRSLGQLDEGTGSLPSFLQTHPQPADRAEIVDEMAGDLDLSDAVRLEEDYSRHLEGLPFGEDPRRGYVSGEEVFLPQLGLRFPAPIGWYVAISANRVEVSAPEGDLCFVLRRTGFATTAEAIAEVEGRLEDLEIEERVETTLHDWPALRLEGRLGDSWLNPIRFLALAVVVDGEVLVIGGLGEESALEQQRGTILAMIEGVTRLTDPLALDVAPARVHLVEVEQRATFQDLVQDWPLPPGSGLSPAGLALLNGVTPETVIEPGTLLRVLRR